eukprot:1337997-Amphidinium_carterae.1
MSYIVTTGLCPSLKPMLALAKGQFRTDFPKSFHTGKVQGPIAHAIESLQNHIQSDIVDFVSTRVLHAFGDK